MSADAPLPAQDWALLASQGHVAGKRTAASLKRLFVPACAALIVGILAVHQAFTRPAPTLPGWIQDYIPSADPATFTTVPGGGTAGWQLSYLAGLTPEPGLGARDFKALVDATGADLARYGDRTQLWQAVATLDRQPLVTRPAKVFGANAGRLGQGVIALPQGYRPGGSVWVTSWVEGRLSWAELGPSGCQWLMGSPDLGQALGCDAAPAGQFADKAYGVERFALFRPAPATP